MLQSHRLEYLAVFCAAPNIQSICLIQTEKVLRSFQTTTLDDPPGPQSIIVIICSTGHLITRLLHARNRIFGQEPR